MTFPAIFFLIYYDIYVHVHIHVLRLRCFFSCSNIDGISSYPLPLSHSEGVTYMHLSGKSSIIILWMSQTRSLLGANMSHSYQINVYKAESHRESSKARNWSLLRRKDADYIRNYDDALRTLHSFLRYFNGNNLMTYASKLKVDRGIPGAPILYLSGKYNL